MTTAPVEVNPETGRKIDIEACTASINDALGTILYSVVSTLCDPKLREELPLLAKRGRKVHLGTDGTTDEEFGVEKDGDYFLVVKRYYNPEGNVAFSEAVRMDPTFTFIDAAYVNIDSPNGAGRRFDQPVALNEILEVMRKDEEEQQRLKDRQGVLRSWFRTHNITRTVELHPTISLSGVVEIITEWEKLAASLKSTPTKAKRDEATVVSSDPKKSPTRA